MMMMMILLETGDEPKKYNKLFLSFSTLKLNDLNQHFSLLLLWICYTARQVLFYRSFHLFLFIYLPGCTHIRVESSSTGGVFL